MENFLRMAPGLGHTGLVQIRGEPGDGSQGPYGEVWLIAVALASGLKAGPDPGQDMEKADVELTLLEEVRGTYHPRVKAQVKTQIGLIPYEDGMFRYNLDVETYNILVKTNHSTRRVLVVIGLPRDGERVKLQGSEGTLLVGQAAWVSLEGLPVSNNNSKQVVKLPVTNSVDPAGLRRMLLEYGVNSSTLVPTTDPWDETSSQPGGREA